MNRRNFSRGILFKLALAPVLLAASQQSGAHSAFTSPTAYIDSDHPAIQSAVALVVGDAVQQVQRAVRIHDFVRDQVRFGWASGFYDQSASAVFDSQVGYCNTKGTLFVAMLRAAGISARQHFVNIHADILEPFIDPGTPYVDHSYTEVFLGGQWLAVDSYIVDKPLFLAAQHRLRQESRVLGFGIHADGVCDWDGTGPAFSQFVNNGRYLGLSSRDFGVFGDVGAFYESGNGVNRLNFLLKLAFGVLARGANQRIEAVRRASPAK